MKSLLAIAIGLFAAGAGAACLYYRHKERNAKNLEIEIAEDDASPFHEDSVEEEEAPAPESVPDDPVAEGPSGETETPAEEPAEPEEEKATEKEK